MSSLYITDGVWHSPLSGHSFFFLQSHPNDCCFGNKILRLWEDIIKPILLRQLYFILTVFLLNIFCMVWFRGKCFESRRKNILSMLLFTLLEKGGLNHIIFSFLFFALCWLLVQYSLMSHWNHFLWKDPCMALLIHRKYRYWMTFWILVFQLTVAIVWERLVDG